MSGYVQLNPSRKAKGDVKKAVLTYENGTTEICNLGENDIFLITTGTCRIDVWHVDQETEEVTITIEGFPS